MSYEGYEQILCKNGHYTCFDCYSVPDLENDWSCSYCNERAVWSNSVDETNGICEEDNCPEMYSGSEKCDICPKRIDGYVELEVKEEEEIEICKCCGSSKVIKERTYKVPKNKGHKINQ